MMRPDATLPEVYLCTGAVDFRKGIGALAVMVEASLGLNPFSQHLFVFTNRYRNQVKILYWEKNGFCLWQKRLEQERFHWLRGSDNATVTITGQQLNWLLDGYDLKAMKGHKNQQYRAIF